MTTKKMVVKKINEILDKPKPEWTDEEKVLVDRYGYWKEEFENEFEEQQTTIIIEITKGKTAKITVRNTGDEITEWTLTEKWEDKKEV